jgi:hypothetical protein
MHVRFVVAAVIGMFSAMGQAQMKTVTPTSADIAAGAAASKTSPHPMPANTAAGARLGRDGAGSSSVSPTMPLPPGGNRYPADLVNLGGQVVGEAQSHAVYLLNGGSSSTLCTVGSCWGDPEGFLKNLSKSDFIHLVDQYVGRYDSRRYTNGPDAGVITSPAFSRLTDADVLGIVHAVVTALGYPTGENHIYHVFLPPGADECFDSTFSVCYSPDNVGTFFFCAYHGSADFADIGHVLYSVEPYQNVTGCNVLPGTPNGTMADSTNNVLSHELFETITDPEGSAWRNLESNSLYLSEIGDECSFLYFGPGEGGFNPSVFRIGRKQYAVQPEYNNSSHACSTSLDDSGNGDN